jgi:hypothetical protein
MKSQVPKGKRVTYARTVVAVRPEKAEANRVRITVGGNLLTYLGETLTEAASIETTKLLINSFLHTWSLTWYNQYIKLLHTKLTKRLPVYAIPY